MELFRQQAVDAQKVEMTGDIFLAQPVSTQLITLLLVFLVGMLALILALGSYARTENVPGLLVTSTGLVKILTPQFSTLESLQIREGDHVSQGQQLVSLKLDSETASGSSPESNLLSILEDQSDIIYGQIQNQEGLMAASLLELNSEKEALVAGIRLLTEQSGYKTEILASVQSSFEDMQGLLERGFISKREYENHQQSWLEQETQLTQIKHRLTETRARMQQVNIRIAKVPDEYQDAVARLEQQLNTLRSNSEEIKAQQTIVIYAPVNGVVTALNTHSLGIHLLPQTPLLTILPDGGEFQAELYVPSRAMGFVEEGQEVRIMYDAFPYQYFGSYPAVVEKITETILNTQEANSLLALKEPSYRVTAKVGNQNIQLKNQRLRLQPGMLLRANIVLERRSFIDWILQPYNAVRQRS